MAQPKAAVMIYPSFSLQEITCLTSALTVWYEREVDVFASSREIVQSEDGFQVTAGRTPLLLAKAGLLRNRKFTGGFFEEMVDYLDFMPKGNVVHAPVCRDGNVITAIGFAFREFAVAVLRAVGIACDDDLFGSVSGTYTEEELTFRMGEESFREFLAQYRAT
jgi:4-methyl-5(b-hydroxyethyl)-thiazole monophosphate biosynthesis